MPKDAINFTLRGDDIKLLERWKKVLIGVYGKSTNTGAVRAALVGVLNNEQNKKQEHKP